MRRRFAAGTAMVAALALLGFGAPAAAQIPAAQQAQQLQRMQEQMQRLDQTIQRMAQVQQRAQEMERLMLQDMERVRQMETLHTQEGTQLQTQQRLQEQEHVRLMAQSMATAAGDMNQAMLSLREMAQTRTWDRDMEQQMERLRVTMQETCNQMEEGLRIMEHLRDRLSQP